MFKELLLNSDHFIFVCECVYTCMYCYVMAHGLRIQRSFLAIQCLAHVHVHGAETPPTRCFRTMAECSNPFSRFFSSAEAVEQQKSSVVQQRCEIGYALTRVFLCTPSSSVEGHADRPRFVVSLPQLSRDQERLGKSGDMDLDTLTQVQCTMYYPISTRDT